MNRLDRASLGNFGGCAPVGEGVAEALAQSAGTKPGADGQAHQARDIAGEGVAEMRIDYGPGYRVYFIRQGAPVYLLLTGGDKSTQHRDIERAKAMARELKQERDS